MSADAFKREFDATHHASFAGMGAGEGVYTPPSTQASPTPAPIPGVRVYINHDSLVQGDFRQRSFAAVTIDYLLADVTPAVDGTLLLDGVTWVNVEEIEGGNDGSISKWAVRRG